MNWGEYPANEPCNYHGCNIGICGCDTRTEEQLKIHPTLDRILVRRHDEPANPILLTDRKKYQICKVLAVGPGAWRDGAFCKTAVKPGDNVLIPGYGGQNPDHEFEDGSFLVQEGDIGAIVG